MVETLFVSNPLFASALHDPVYRLMPTHQQDCNAVWSINVGLCRGKVGLCIKLAILIAVGCIVPAMYIFIRSTYFLGYKRR